MDGTYTPAAQNEAAPEKRARALVGGSVLEGFGAVATIALAIVGLTGTDSMVLAAIATIVVGAGFLAEGGAFGIQPASQAEGKDWLMAVTRSDIQGGVGIMLLGVLALLGVVPLTLLCVAVIALGLAFVLHLRLLSGLGAVILGILAVVGLSSLTLVLVALLILGVGLLLGGAQQAVSTRVAHA